MTIASGLAAGNPRLFRVTKDFGPHVAWDGKVSYLEMDDTILTIADGILAKGPTSEDEVNGDVVQKVRINLRRTFQVFSSNNGTRQHMIEGRRTLGCRIQKAFVKKPHDFLQQYRNVLVAKDSEAYLIEKINGARFWAQLKQPILTHFDAARIASFDEGNELYLVENMHFLVGDIDCSFPGVDLSDKPPPRPSPVYKVVPPLGPGDSRKARPWRQ
jgi:hypothetical protein